MAIRIRNKRSQNSQLPVNKKTPADVFAIAREHNIQTLPIDLQALCRLLGIGIQYTPLEDNASGKLSHDGDRWMIHVNSLHHPRRQRFTIAHELGHYFLHRDSQRGYEDTTFHRGKRYTKTELEADNFAGALLMPKDEFKQYIRNSSNKIDEITDYFDTSSMAVKKRADILRNDAYEF
tara:strand:+ start:2426 stop:2959 length:534 start_codon:yes stop_codon:yes gene_type:complete